MHALCTVGRVQTETAARRLRELILDGTYPPGSRLTEMEAAASLAMSRTPVREALQALAADGLVRPTGRGVVVVALAEHDLREAYLVRAALEALTAELAAHRQRTGHLAPADLAALRQDAKAAAEATAAGRLDEAVRHNRRFHRRIAELAGNTIALATLDRLWDQIQVSTMHSLAPAPRTAQVADQHEQLLAAIVAGRVQDAARCARRHVLDTAMASNVQDSEG
jgi:DNA-binding GntR family transcriptional regulator